MDDLDQQRATMKLTHLLFSLCILSFGALPVRAADLVLVEEGQPRAQIVIGENAARTTRLTGKLGQELSSRAYRVLWS